jgi:hypothetical protein
MSMRDQEWIKTLEDGRKVKFIYQELPADGAFITAQIVERKCGAAPFHLRACAWVTRYSEIIHLDD